jgi:cell division protein FtsB
VPSSLSLYNYKLSGVTDGPLSFAKAMSEVAVVGNLENLELSRVSVSREAFYEEHAGAGLLNVDESQGSFDQMQGVTVTEADSKQQQENMHSKVEMKKIPKQSVHEAELAKLQQENMQMKAEMKKMQQQQQENMEMKAEMKKMQEQLALLAARGAHDLI